jgi:hypothetical protein
MLWGVVLLIWLTGRVVPCDAAEGNNLQKEGRLESTSPVNGLRFGCEMFGYVRHWAVAGPQRTPYVGRGGSSQQMRGEALDQKVVTPPSQAALGSPSPLGEPWRFYSPGENIFVECTAFYHKLTVLDYYAFTEIHAPRDMSPPANLWAAGRADLWVNEVHVSRIEVAHGHRVESTLIKLPLRRGANRICVRLQALGGRDTRMLFGLQVLEGTQDLRVQLSGPASQTEQLVAAERWLRGVKPEGQDALVSAQPAPAGVSVRMGAPAKPRAWSTGKSRVSLDPARSFQVTLALTTAGQKLQRLLEIPANQPVLAKPTVSLEEHRRQYLEQMAASGKPAHDVLQMLARRLLGPPSSMDTPAIDATLQGIEGRKDCSDFTLAALLRLYRLGLVTADEAAKIKRVALGFRYWYDEPGTDAMCFDSENHSLLFHGCQLLAGRLFPDETFANTQRQGKEQVTIAAKRCRDWLDKREKNGFVEFFSSTYIPLTMAALMNLVDFSGDADLSRRSTALADRLFVDLATQSFDGVTVAPQGRVYRNVLYPQGSGTQALLSFATTDALVSYSNWVAFLASSRTYRPPTGLGEWMRQPATSRSRQSEAEIVLYKTPAYLLTSVAIPASFSGKGGKRAGLQPGSAGYQQHLWHATLGRDCHVFVNHPGASFDQSESRPGFWYGNGVLPRISQREGMLLQIFDIPESHPIGFTHAHWPADAFQRQEVLDHWAFGLKGNGCIALWCSAPLQAHADVLSGRELRAWGRRTAWLCVCGDVRESGGWDGFRRSCLARGPSFDTATRVLTQSGQEPLRWEAAKQ